MHVPTQYPVRVPASKLAVVDGPAEPTSPDRRYPVVIPAAGRGTRLEPLTRHCSKELLPLGDGVVISHILAELQESGISDVIIVSRAEKIDVAAYVDWTDKNGASGLQVQLLHQGDVPGNGGAILSAASVIGHRPFLVVWGDEVFLGPSRIRQLISAYETLGAPCICLTRVSDADVPNCGIAEGETDCCGYFRVRRILEKPQPAATMSRWASVGGFVLEPSVVQVLAALRPGADGEVYLSTALDIVARQGSLFGVPIDAQWFETGSYMGYSRAQAVFADVQRVTG